MSAIGPVGAGSSAFTNLSRVNGTQGTQGAGGADRAAKAGGFGEAVLKGLDNVAGMERQADNLVATMASGGNVQISDVMAASSKANLGMSIVNELRTRGLEAYQSIINIQV